jgi:FdhD protein
VPDHTCLPQFTTNYPVTKISAGNIMEITDQVIREVPFTIYLNNAEWVTLLCSPAALDYLAVGFLRSEGLLATHDDLCSLKLDTTRNIVYVETRNTPPVLASTSARHYRGSSGSKGSTTAYRAGCWQVTSTLTLTPTTASYLSRTLQDNSKLFRQTGGVHNAALFAGDRLEVFHEDIGRHNALDKISGQCFLQNISLDNKVLAFSGRVSSEILLKVGRMGIPVLISRSAPTDLALQLATELGITVIGFARGKKINIYTHHWRIQS